MSIPIRSIRQAVTPQQKLNQIKAVVFGHAVGDAVGVPVEFSTRQKRLRPFHLQRGSKVPAYHQFLSRMCVQAVNMGGDTDTVAAIAGSLAGALYGYDGIPTEWINKLLCRQTIKEICNRATSAWK